SWSNMTGTSKTSAATTPRAFSLAVLRAPRRWVMRGQRWMHTMAMAAGTPARFAVRCFTSSSSSSTHEGVPVRALGRPHDRHVVVQALALNDEYGVDGLL